MRSAMQIFQTHQINGRAKPEAKKAVQLGFATTDIEMFIFLGQ